MACPICKKYLGKLLIHPGECPQATSVLCRRCHHRGHMTNQCSESRWPQYERPTTLEELIPAYMRARYGITSHTKIEFPTKRSLPDTEHELGEVNTIEVPSDYTQMKEFIDKHGIKVEKVTKESFPKCREAVKAWGISHGYRIILMPTA